MISFEKVMRLCFLLICTAVISHFCNKQTHGFSIHAISSHRAYNPQYATRPLTRNEIKKVESALTQPFSFLGCGGQAFAFQSKDGKYVIKFFRQRILKRSFILNALPLPSFLHRYREKRNTKRDDKFQRDFSSYKIAFEQLQKETAVIYSHLHRTDHLKKNFELTDPLGIKHILDLNQFDFVIQKRAVRVHEHISNLMREGEIEKAKRAVEQVFQTILTRANKGFIDRDPLIRTNCGFIEDKMVKIDVGKFAFSEAIKSPEGLKKDVMAIIAPFGDWLESEFPELVVTFEEQKQMVQAL